MTGTACPINSPAADIVVTGCLLRDGLKCQEVSESVEHNGAFHFSLALTVSEITPLRFLYVILACACYCH